MFYGDDAVETALGRLETKHALVYRAVIELASNFGSALSVMQIYNLREALILQRFRTPGHAETSASAMDQAQLHMYAEHLRSLPQTKKTRAQIRSIEGGRARLKHSRASALRMALAAVGEITPVTQDLVLRILRNRTDLPFLLGDNPCVYSNHYQREVRVHGVLGATSQGLMIAMPLNPKTYVLAVDPARYKFHDNERVVNLDRRDDVTRLNRLQVLAAGECVYFAEPSHGDYAREILDACPIPDGKGIAGFQVLEQMESADDGSPESRTFRPIERGQGASRGDLLMMFEHQLPETLDLSVFETVEFEGVSEAYGPRCSYLLERFNPTEHLADPGPLGMDDLVRDVEADLETW